MSADKNPRGIPRAPFIVNIQSINYSFALTDPQENVQEHIGGHGVDVEPTLKQFQDAIAKYRYMDSNLTQRRAGLEQKIPDIKKTLSMVEYIGDRRVSLLIHCISIVMIKHYL